MQLKHLRMILVGLILEPWAATLPSRHQNLIFEIMVIKNWGNLYQQQMYFKLKKKPLAMDPRRRFI